MEDIRRKLIIALLAFAYFQIMDIEIFSIWPFLFVYFPIVTILLLQIYKYIRLKRTQAKSKID